MYGKTMVKTVIRVDDRLIHGQTIVAWCPTLAIQEIIAVDDDSANNPLLKSILTMSVPKQYSASITTVEQAQKMLKEQSDKKRLVIVKKPHQLKAFETFKDQIEMIILGNMAKREDTKHQLSGATGIFYLSDQDVKDIDTLVENGFKVDFQQLPNTVKISWDTFRKSI